MSEVPKIVYDRLRAAQPRGSHPDADLLTAFAEQSLSAPERENVLVHLAACPDCRETVALSFPALEIVGQAAEMPIPASIPAIPNRRNWFVWPNLRWAALAAGVVVIASVLILRPGRLHNDSTIASVNRATEPPVASANDIKPEIKTMTTLPSTSRPPVADGQTRTLAKAKSAKSYGIGAGTPSDLVRSGGAVAELKTPVPSRLAGAWANDNVLHDSSRGYSNATDELASNAPKAVGSAVSAPATPAAPSASTETSAVTNGVPTQTPEETRILAENRAEPAAILRAKPAKKDQESRKAEAKAKVEALGASSNYASSFGMPISALWKLSEGALQRSVDSGSTWETVLHPDQKLLCRAVRGNEIWAGGQSGTLFHSTDSGNTWTQLHPSLITNGKLSASKDQLLTADIVSVEFVGSGAVSVITSQKETWTSLDAGRTWSKKSATLN